MTINELKKRYFRVVMGHPKGVFCHYGDCSKYYCGVCDCGLFQYLNPYLDGQDANLRKAIYKILYGAYDLDYAKHLCILEKLRETGWGEKVWKEAEDYAKKHPVKKGDVEKIMKSINRSDDPFPSGCSGPE